MERALSLYRFNTKKGEKRREIGRERLADKNRHCWTKRKKKTLIDRKRDRGRQSGTDSKDSMTS